MIISINSILINFIFWLNKQNNCTNKYSFVLSCLVCNSHTYFIFMEVCTNSHRYAYIHLSSEYQTTTCFYANEKQLCRSMREVYNLMTIISLASIYFFIFWYTIKDITFLKVVINTIHLTASIFVMVYLFYIPLTWILSTHI